MEKHKSSAILNETEEQWSLKTKAQIEYEWSQNSLREYWSDLEYKPKFGLTSKIEGVQ